MGKDESLVRDRRDAREAPLLLLHRGEAELGEPPDRPLAELLQPVGRARGAVSRERLEVGDVRCCPVGDIGHVTTASSRSQSYPFSSSSRASSLPPDLTIRPPARTCTTSGSMCVRMRSQCVTSTVALSGRRSLSTVW